MKRFIANSLVGWAPLIVLAIAMTFFGLICRKQVSPELQRLDLIAPILHVRSVPNPHSVYGAYVSEIIDGDSLYVFVPVWQGIIIKAHVRLSGIDTPEIRGAKCPEEKELGLKAKAKLKEWLPENSPIQLHVTKARDKYGRVVVEIHMQNGANIAEMLVQHGLARAYDGKSKRQGWCGKEDTPKDGTGEKKK